MIYLEMTRDPMHGGGGWAFPNCVWSPARKKDGSRWAFWNKIRQVKDGDIVIHLRGKPPKAAFVGYSIASGDGFETRTRPPNPGEWGFADRFFRANLKHFTPFHQNVGLREIFSTRKPELEEYFKRNKNLRKEKANIFFVIQKNRLQCLNGAYFSDVDKELVRILFAGDGTYFPSESAVAEQQVQFSSVQTGTQLRQIRSRIGQTEFARRIKKLYANRCCIPGCNVVGKEFLVAAHIARWSDNEERRGHLSNGLCLCLMHDKAFELGLFFLDDHYRIFINPRKCSGLEPHLRELVEASGQQIRMANVVPSPGALSEHRQRFGIDELTRDR